MWTARILSIIVKNMQSYIVAVVWGAAEVWSLCKSKVWRKSQQPVVLPDVLPHHGPNSGLAKTNKASERDMNCHSSSSHFVFPHTRIVVPQFQNSLVEMCHEAEVGSPSFIN